jgi:hypothetical protein
MKNAINWILKETEAANIRWKRLKVAPRVTLKKNTLGTTYEATCAKEADKLFKKAYVGLHGAKEIVCLVVIDIKGRWHFIDANGGKVGQIIEEIFSNFFEPRCYVYKKHKTA